MPKKKRICKLPERPKTYDDWYEKVGYKYPLKERQSGSYNTEAKAVRERDNYECQKCGLSKLKADSLLTEVNHIWLQCCGGGKDPDNLILLCHPCHKYAPNPDTFFDYASTGLPQKYDLILVFCKAVALAVAFRGKCTPSMKESILLLKTVENFIKDHWEMIDKPMLYHSLNGTLQQQTPNDVIEGATKFAKKYSLDKSIDQFNSLYELFQVLVAEPYSNMFKTNDRYKNI